MVVWEFGGLYREKKAASKVKCVAQTFDNESRQVRRILPGAKNHSQLRGFVHATQL